MKSNLSTNKLTTLSIFTAIQVILLIICMSVPSGKLTILCVISAINGLLYRGGTKVSHLLISFAAVSILGYLFMIHPTTYILYVCFFGLYGIVHHIFKYKPFIIKQLVRWGYFIVSAVLSYSIITFIVKVPIETSLSYFILIPAGIIAFAVYQYAYELLLSIILSNSYLRRLFTIH